VLDAGAVRKTITYGSEQPRQQETIILWCLTVECWVLIDNFHNRRQ
jgi:hypothetical protein